MRSNKTLSTLAGLAFLGFATFNSAQSEVVTWDFTGSQASSTGSSYGNSRTFLGDDGLTTVTATAWALTGGYSNSYIQNAYLGKYDAGLGVTNREESGSNSQHTLDNVDRKDFIAFRFSTAIEATSAFLTAFSASGVTGDPDTDITVWFGNIGGAADLTSMTLADLNNSFGGPITSIGTNGVATRLAEFGPLDAANLVIIAADVNDSTPDDMIKIGVLSAFIPNGDTETDVPEPATMSILGLGLLGALRLRRRARKAS